MYNTVNQPNVKFGILLDLLLSIVIILTINYKHFKFNYMKKLILLSSVLLFFSVHLFSATWRVNNFPNAQADFTSLSDAIDAAADGDVIYIEGTGYAYNEGQVSLTKSLTFYGTGYFLLENEDTQANHFPSEVNIQLTVDAGSEGSLFSGISFLGGMIYVYTSEITFERCRINSEMRLRGWEQDVSNFMMKQCYVHSNIWMWDMAYASSNIVFQNNVFYDGLSLNKDLGSYEVKNNIFSGHYSSLYGVNMTVQNNIIDGGVNSFEGNNNLVQNNIIGTGDMPELGENNMGGVDLTELFVDYPDGANTSLDAMYELQTGSLAQGYGVGGVDCGIFDGNFPYVLSGLPPIPRIYESNISGVGNATGLQVHIKAKSQH